MKNTDPRRRRVTIRIGMPDDLGPRTLSSGTTPEGARVQVTEPEEGSTGNRATVERLDNQGTIPGLLEDRAVVIYSTPGMRARGERPKRIYFGSVRAARSVAKSIRMDSPGNPGRKN